MSSAGQRPLQIGDVVELRPPAEILATLDEHGALDGLPFMPEMLEYMGRRHRVSTRVEKVCDTINGMRSRRMHSTVYLEDLRCDGSAHGGCQAACRLYWRDDWLTRIPDGSEPSPVSRQDEAYLQLERVARAGSRPPPGEGGELDLFRCQATEALTASEPLSNNELSQYARELRSGNVGVRRLLVVAIRAIGVRLGGILVGPISLQSRIISRLRPGRLVTEPMRLAVGDWVRVRSDEEIVRTLNASGKNRGLWFDREMRSFCGGTYQVKARIERIIDERTGRMLLIESDCIELDGVVCSGDYSKGRWLCPRAIPPYWREAWLTRADPPPPRRPGA